MYITRYQQRCSWCRFPKATQNWDCVIALDIKTASFTQKSATATYQKGDLHFAAQWAPNMQNQHCTYYQQQTRLSPPSQFFYPCSISVCTCYSLPCTRDCMVGMRASESKQGLPAGAAGEEARGGKMGDVGELHPLPACLVWMPVLQPWNGRGKRHNSLSQSICSWLSRPMCGVQRTVPRKALG
jgi:hypothetical protein